MSGRDSGLQRFRVSGFLGPRLEQKGLRLAEIVRQAGLPSGFFGQEKIFVSTEEFFALWRAIAAVSDDPEIGLTLGVEGACTQQYDPTAIAALCSQSFRDAVERMARYKQLTCPEDPRIGVRGREQRWRPQRHQAHPALELDPRVGGGR